MSCQVRVATVTQGESLSCSQTAGELLDHEGSPIKPGLVFDWIVLGIPWCLVCTYTLFCFCTWRGEERGGVKGRGEERYFIIPGISDSFKHNRDMRRREGRQRIKQGEGNGEKRRGMWKGEMREEWRRKWRGEIRREEMEVVRRDEER